MSQELLHPAYDPETKTWFLPDGREASSLKELSTLLVNGETLIGYFPLSHNTNPILATLRNREAVKPRVGLARSSFNETLPPKEKGPRKLPAHPVERRPIGEAEGQTIRRLINQGWSAGQIGAQLHRTRNSIIGWCQRNKVRLQGSKLQKSPPPQ